MKTLDARLQARIEARTANVAVAGLGYVGLPLAVEVARAGFQVCGIDVDPNRVERIRQGESYIGDVPADRLAALVAEGRLSARTDYGGVADADVILICVPTPLTRSKEPDLSFVAAAVREVAHRLRPEQLVVLESTTYPGTTQELVRPALEAGGLRVGRDFYLAFSPERIDPGNRRHAYRDIPKVVGGVTPACTDLACRFYSHIVRQVVPVSSSTVAEMVKVYENVFRNVNIALVNELTLLCDRMGLDVWEIIEAAATKPYGFMPFSPGPGVGGHCIPVDPYYLAAKAREYDFHVRFIELAAAVNDSMPYYVRSRTVAALGARGKALAGSRVLVLGVAYKKDVADARESPALKILELLERGGAQVSYHDPLVPEVTLANPGGTLRSVPLTDEAIAEADCVVVATDHTAVDYERVAAQARLVVDTRNVYRTRRPNVVRL
ncbi:MAG: nucleotide sugar dehydrogenase [Armatimonadota bacterium]|nr:nucleotide sugar dehydrogenase [Armatimonadota bacterium]